MIPNAKLRDVDDADMQSITQEHADRLRAKRLASAVGQSPLRRFLQNFLFRIRASRVLLEQATPQDLNMRGRVVFNGTTVTVLIAELPPIEFNFTGGNTAHLIGAWRARHEVEPMTHERILAMTLGTFERNGGEE